MAMSNRTKRGAILLVGVLSGLVSVWLSVALLALAAFWIAWGQEPRRMEEFVGSLPYGNQLLEAAVKLDQFLS
jgi:hypothetical protein